MKADNLGNRMKAYESHECQRRFIPGLPMYARIDGRGFSKFTKGMEKPYDLRLINAMIDVTKVLVKETQATIGYVQSDEISLVWICSDLFDRKSHKLHSILASLAASAFANALIQHFENWQPLLTKMPHFDCRVVMMPSQMEAANMLLWRNLDATKNAISMTASSFFSHRELQNLKSAEKQDLLFQKGINFDLYPPSFKRGTFVRRENIQISLSDEQLRKIPENHRPNGLVVRSVIKEFDLPPLVKIQNLVDVLFYQSDVILKST